MDIKHTGQCLTQPIASTTNQQLLVFSDYYQGSYQSWELSRTFSSGHLKTWAIGKYPYKHKKENGWVTQNASNT